jgi:peptide/nickel transport system permease protein
MVDVAIAAELEREVGPEGGEVYQQGSLAQLVLRTFTKNKLAVAGVAIVVLMVLFCFVGPLIYHTNQVYTDIINSNEPPSGAHPLGTDFEGSDVLALIVTGARYVLLSAAIAGVIAVAVGAAMGLVAGYLGGPVDGLLSRFTDFVLTVPTFPLLVVLSTVWKFSSPLAMGLILGITGWGGLARAVRSQTLSLRERPYLEAARGLGLPTRHIITTEVLPNVSSYVAMNLLIAIIGSIYAETGLFFLGIMPATFNNWGVMLNLAVFSAGAMTSPQALLYLLSPLVSILLLTLAIVLILDAVDELFNPRLRTL